MILPIIVVLIVIGGFFWALYNGFVSKKLRIDEAWSQIDIQLKRRADLIPNLVEIVKGYAKHEKTVFEDVTKARAALMGASGPRESAKAEAGLSSALKSLFAIAENYPKLEASENFKSLQEEMTDTEDKVAYSRQFYNTVVLEFNTALKVFPNFLFANILGFKEADFFGEVSAQERNAVKVSF